MDNNEIQVYQTGRYISSSETLAVMHLCVHLQNGKAVYFIEDILQQKVEIPPTTLTTFFDLCQKDEFAKLYCRAPKHNTRDALQQTFNKGSYSGAYIHVFIRQTCNKSTNKIHYLGKILMVYIIPKLLTYFSSQGTIFKKSEK
jgi:hypothetical protein